MRPLQLFVIFSFFNISAYCTPFGPFQFVIVSDSMQSSNGSSNINNFKKLEVFNYSNLKKVALLDNIQFNKSAQSSIPQILYVRNQLGEEDSDFKIYYLDSNYNLIGWDGERINEINDSRPILRVISKESEKDKGVYFVTDFDGIFSYYNPKSLEIKTYDYSKSGQLFHGNKGNFYFFKDDLYFYIHTLGIIRFNIFTRAFKIIVLYPGYLDSESCSNRQLTDIKFLVDADSIWITCISGTKGIGSTIFHFDNEPLDFDNRPNVSSIRHITHMKKDVIDMSWGIEKGSIWFLTQNDSSPSFNSEIDIYTIYDNYQLIYEKTIHLNVTNATAIITPPYFYMDDPIVFKKKKDSAIMIVAVIISSLIIVIIISINSWMKEIIVRNSEIVLRIVARDHGNNSIMHIITRLYIQFTRIFC